MQSIDHLNLNKPERERGLKLKKSSGTLLEEKEGDKNEERKCPCSIQAISIEFLWGVLL